MSAQILTATTSMAGVSPAGNNQQGISIYSTAQACYNSAVAAPPMVGEGTLFAQSVTPAAMQGGFVSADDFLASATISFGSTGEVVTYSREDETDPPIGQLQPIGEGIIPMLLCAAMYAFSRYKKHSALAIFTNIRTRMKKNMRYLSRALMLCLFCMCFVPEAEAALSAAGDTVSIVYPRTIETTTKKQISESDYNANRDKEGYSYEGSRRNHTYYYTTTTTSTTYIILSVTSRGTGNIVEGVTGISGRNNLWVLHATQDDSNSVTALRYQNLGTGQWLSWEMAGTDGFKLTLVDNEANARPFGHMDNDIADQYVYKDEGRVKFYPTIDNNGQLLYWYSKGEEKTSTTTDPATGYKTTVTTTKSFVFATDQVRSSYMEFNRWTQRSVRRLDMETSPEQVNFPYAADDAEAQTQIVSVRYEFALRDSVYLYNVPAERYGYSSKKITTDVKHITDIQTLRNQYGLTLISGWITNYNKTDRDNTDVYSYVENDQIDNTRSTSSAYDESSRPLLKKGDAAAAGTAFVQTITPLGRSPFNVVNDKKETDNFDDILAVRATLNDGTTATAEVNVVRSAYHYRDIDALTLRVSPANYVFNGTAGTQDFNVDITYRQGYEIHTAEETVYSGNVSETPKQIRDLDASSFRLLKTDLSGDSPWGKIDKIDDINNILTISVEQNPSSNNLEALLTSYVKLGNAQLTRQNTVRQRGYNSEGDVVFVPNKGVTGSDFMGDNQDHQSVHQSEKTIYYTAGEEIALWLSEVNFLGYMRWYDYNTGKDPRYDTDGNDYSKLWRRKPYVETQSWQTTVQNEFKSINFDGKTSHGIYFTYDDGLSQIPDQYADKIAARIPLITGWQDGKKSRDIACDVSAYTDYIDDQTTTKQVKEPTLSYREVFHLRPATEIADSLAKCTGGKYYETHTYYAPVGASVFLDTRFAHCNALNHESEKCYFFYNPNGKLAQLGKDAYAQWYKNGKVLNINASDSWDRYATDGGKSLDYLKVTSNTAGTTDTYELRIPADANKTGKEICVAKFTVTYLDRTQHGPTTNTIITDQEIAEKYILLSKQDFNFNQKPGTTAITYYDKPMPWAETTYGFFYPDWASKGMGRKSAEAATDFPYYGEYALVNKVDKKWAKSEQHGGAANGYCMYVDGTMQPGLVASISTDTRICSGQQLYCYAWVNNAAPANYTAGALPIFRFNVQGRNKGDDNWTDVGTFFAGEIEKGGKWQQVCFPVLSAHDYDESRVSIYNFATTNSGNDFLIDDICLYASKLPLSAYQAITTCTSDSLEATVARVDYARLTGDWDCKLIYYQFYNNTTQQPVQINAYYYPDGTADTDKSADYGFLKIPESNYDPAKTKDATYRVDRCLHDDESGMVYTSAAAFLDSLVALLNRDKLKEVTRKGYVWTNEDNEGRYILYIGHIMSKDVLTAGNSYELRMAASVPELAQPECALRTALPINNRTSFTFNGETYPTTGACANGLYPIEVVVKNQMKVGEGTQTLEAIAKADWLVGESFDDIFYSTKTPSATEKAVADAAFLEHYGYDRGLLRDAIVDMRRPSSDEVPNPNYYATSVEQLQRNAFNDKSRYDMIVDLCNRGYLKLYMGTESFYMEGGDTIRFWIYPITGTAQTEYNGQTYTLDDCDEPSYIRVTTLKSDYAVNLNPVKREDMTDVEKGQIPRVRVAASQVNKFTIPISDITDNVIFGWDSCHLTSTTDPDMQAMLNSHYSADKFSMRYTQDIVYQDALSHPEKPYYTAGSQIVFTAINQTYVDYLKQRHDIANAEHTKDESQRQYPHDVLWGEGQPGFQYPNTHTMRPGYEYTMVTTLLTTDYRKQVDASCPIGEVYFTVVVIPDTMIWRPTVSNEWGDDRNWHALINGVEQSFGYVPLPETMVILPTLSDKGKYPYLSDYVRYPMDSHYTPNSCKKIHFRNTATLLNQHLLAYDSAYVDMHVQLPANGGWYSVAAPLQDVYSGDFFVPHSGTYQSGKNLETNDDFTVSGFLGARYTDAAYAFWASYYNSEVATYHQNGGTSMNTYATNTLSFSKSNSLDEPILPGHGFQLKGYGPDGTTEADIRLPKPDTRYQWYDPSGEGTGKYADIPSRSKAYKFAFDADKNGTMQIQLKNDQPSEYFLFGNPTMAYLNMETFCNDNSTVIEKQYQYMDGSTWKTLTPNTTTQYSDRFIAPMQSVLLRAKDGAATSLTVTVKSTQLAIYNLEGDRVGSDEEGDDESVHYAPRRGNGHYLRNAVMQMTVYTPRRTQDGNTPYARGFAALAVQEFADNGYEQGEDVPFFSSGVEAGNIASSVATSPLSIYTLAGSEALMADVRKQIGVVPLGFLANNLVRNKFAQLTLTFTLSNTWNEECYLVDSQTGDKLRIMNGTAVTIPMPQDHELRYYIQGTYRETPDTPTGDHTPASDHPDSNIRAFSGTTGSITVVADDPIREVRIFDVLGRLVNEVQPSVETALCTMNACSGMAVVEVVLRNGIKAKQKVLVK